MRTLILTSLLLASAPNVPPAIAGESCPANVVCIAGLPCVSLTTASGGREAHFDGGISVFATYDWTASKCSAISQLPFESSVPIEGSVEANEDFVVTGIPPGTPLSIHARIRVIANAFAGGVVPTPNHATGWLEEAGAGGVEATALVNHPDPPVDIDQVLGLDFANLAGEPFRLTMGASSLASNGGSRADVTLSFVDLPAGASVQSCQSGGPPVPTHVVTWGNLKSRYR